MDNDLSKILKGLKKSIADMLEAGRDPIVIVHDRDTIQDKEIFGCPVVCNQYLDFNTYIVMAKTNPFKWEAEPLSPSFLFEFLEV